MAFDYSNLTLEDVERIIRAATESSRAQARAQPPRPPLHGAIDYRKRPDGVWEMPR